MVNDETKRLVHLLINNKEILKGDPSYENIKSEFSLLKSLFRDIYMELKEPDDTGTDAYSLLKVPYQVFPYHSDEFNAINKYFFSTSYHYILFYLTLHQIDDYYIRGQEQFLYNSLLSDLKTLSIDWLEKDLMFEPRNYSDLSAHSEVLSYLIDIRALEVVDKRVLGEHFSFSDDSSDELILKILPSFKNINIDIENIDVMYLDNETIKFLDKRFDYYDFKSIIIQSLLSQYYVENDNSPIMEKVFNELHSNESLRQEITDWFEENTFFGVAFSEEHMFLYDNQEEIGLSNLLFPKANEISNDVLELFRYIPFLKDDLLTRKIHYTVNERNGYTVKKEDIISHFIAFTDENKRLSWSKGYLSINSNKKWLRIERIAAKYGFISSINESEYRLSDAMFINGYKFISVD